MANKVYGVTIWGNEFLDGIMQATDKGRLARGKTYANTNRVYEVVLSKNKISAKVEGNYSPYYEVSLVFDISNGDNKDKIIRFIDDNPLTLAGMSNGGMPREMLEYIRQEDISIFTDFDAHCDCYDFMEDYACKHIAGLYYVLTAEIDKNPLLLFTLNDIDLMAHYRIEDKAHIEYPICVEPKNRVGEKCNIPREIRLFSVDDCDLFVLSMLESMPPFAPIDYKEVMQEFYKKIPKSVSSMVYSLRDNHLAKIHQLIKDADIVLQGSLFVYEAFFVIENPLLLLDENRALFDEFEISEETKGIGLRPNDLFELFLSFEDDKGSLSYWCLFYLFRVAYGLIDKKGFLPAVVEDKEGIYVIYKPLECMTVIREQIEHLSVFCWDMCQIEEEFLDGLSASRMMISTLISHFVVGMEFMHKKQKNNPPKISYSFFQGKRLMSHGFEYSNMSRTIYNYFAIFDVLRSDYNYAIHINQKQDKYQISIKIKQHNDKEEFFLKDSLLAYNQVDILKFLSFLSQYLPHVKELIRVNKLNFNKDDLEQFLLKTSSIISNLGVDIVLPKELKNILKPKLSLAVKATSKNLKSFFSLDDMLDYDWKIAIGEHMISVQEFESLLEEGKELIRFKDNFLVLSPKEAQNIFSQINRKQKLNKYELLQAKLNEEAFFTGDLQSFIEQMLTPKQIQPPASLNAELREYQKNGFIWNVNNLLNGFGTILADDMGLGKTIQSIASLLYLIEQGHIKNSTLVIVPTSLLSNWEIEIEKFAPTLSYFAYYGLNRVMERADIIISTYDLVRRDLQEIKKQKIDCLIIDEAQKIKNADTSTSKAIKSIKAKYKIALSGTPVENNLSELWSIFDFALPKYLKSLKEFTKDYARDIEVGKDVQKSRKLKKITAPFMLRRLKTDKTIISDLPEKLTIDEYTTMTKEQAGLYQSVVDETLQQIEASNNQGLIFKLIVSLKQICNHPRNFDNKTAGTIEKSGKTKLLIELLGNILMQNEKVLIFTQYTTMGDILVEMIKKELLSSPLYLHGGMTRAQRGQVVAEFQNNDKCKIFILSLKAGGVGLNLTQANHVIHFDLWFNPAVENQATDRAFRIGQNKNVYVHRLITRNSFEEKIDKIIKAKQQLSDLSVNVGENWLKDLDNKELQEIFSIG